MDIRLGWFSVGSVSRACLRLHLFCLIGSVAAVAVRLPLERIGACLFCWRSEEEDQTAVGFGVVLVCHACLRLSWCDTSFILPSLRGEIVGCCCCSCRRSFCGALGRFFRRPIGYLDYSSIGRCMTNSLTRITTRTHAAHFWGNVKKIGLRNRAQVGSAALNPVIARTAVVYAEGC